jgi:hypothetical protein
MNDLVELEFRDGKRWVPSYLAIQMADLDLFKLTYEEARQEANNAGVRRHVGDSLDKVIGAHFRRMR